ncbi:MAG: hypothetical protein R3E54_00220 [Halioglobus sp.]
MTNRIEAFRQRQPSDTPALLVDPGGDLPDTQAKIPELPAQELTIGALRSAISQHGALIVRGLFPRESMNALMPVIDRVLAACEANSLGQPPPAGPYFDPPTNMASIMPNKARELSNTRRFHRDSGSAMCVEAPSVAESLLDWYEAKGLKHMLTAYLGEPPCLSMKKWVLRRSRLPVAEAGWHQDGAFMGTHINSLNLWIPLNQCGGETGAPGMDVLPRRLNRIAPAEGAQFNWSVSSSQVTAASGDSQLLSPEFEAGDAFFFDHFFLHRTQHGVEFDKIRYAIETWFFGENRFPKNQIPLAW